LVKDEFVIFYILVLLITLFILHIIGFRINKKYRIINSDLLFIVFIGNILNILIVFEFIFINFYEFFLINYIYIYIVYNLFFYCYLQFFNMSDTARRIKILIDMYQKKENSFYKPHYINNSEIIRYRLTRLLDLKQLKIIESKYYLSSKILLHICLCLLILRRLLGIKN